MKRRAFFASVVAALALPFAMAGRLFARPMKMYAKQKIRESTPTEYRRVIEYDYISYHVIVELPNGDRERWRVTAESMPDTTRYIDTDKPVKSLLRYNTESHILEHCEYKPYGILGMPRKGDPVTVVTECRPVELSPANLVRLVPTRLCEERPLNYG